MDFEIFIGTLFKQIETNNTKCVQIIKDNEVIVKEYLGNEDSDKVQLFVDELNGIIIEINDKSWFEQLEIILKHKLFNVVLKAFRNSTILVQACQHKKDSFIIKWLVNTMEVDINVQDDSGRTALMYAVQDKKQNFFINIVKKRDINCFNAIDKKGNNALFYAIDNKSAFYSLASKTNLNHINNDGDSILTYCCRHKNLDYITKLINNYDVDINVINKDGRNAIMYLMETEKIKELQLVLDRTMNKDYINDQGESILSLLVKGMYRPSKKQEPNYILFYLKAIKIIARSGYNLNIPIDDDGNTLIMFFIMTKDYVNVYYLVKNFKELDLTIKNKFGENACSLALKTKNFNLVALLIQHPTFNYLIEDKRGNNILTYLCVNSFNDIFKNLLIKHKELADHLNQKHETPLIIATKYGDLDLVRALLLHSADPNIQDDQGNTPLFYAVDIQNKGIINALVFYHADPHIKNHQGISAYDLAKEIEDPDFEKEDDSGKNYSILDIFDNPLIPSTKRFRKRSKSRFVSAVKKTIQVNKEVEEDPIFDNSEMVSLNEKYRMTINFILDDYSQPYHTYMNLKLFQMMEMETYGYNMDTDPEMFKLLGTTNTSLKMKDENILKLSEIVLNFSYNTILHIL